MSDTPTDRPKTKPPGVDQDRTTLSRDWSHKAPLITCRWDRTGQVVYATAMDGTLQRWDYESGKQTTVTRFDSWAGALAPLPSGRLLTGTYRGELFLLTSATQVKPHSPLDTRTGHTAWIRTAAVSPNGDWVATTGNDRTVRVCRADNPEDARALLGHTDEVYSACFSPDNRQLVTGDLKGTIRTWDVEKGCAGRVLEASSFHHYDPAYRARFGGARRLAFSPDGRWLACGGPGENIFSMAGEFKPAVLLFDWKSGKQKRVLKAADASYQGNICGLAFHPDGFLVGVGGGKSGGRAWFWDVNSDSQSPFHTQVLPTTAKDADLHPSGDRLVIAHYDGKPVRDVKQDIGGAVRVYKIGSKGT